jgi:capsular polysaccharide biosynthesis protein
MYGIVYRQELEEFGISGENMWYIDKQSDSDLLQSVDHFTEEWSQFNIQEHSCPPRGFVLVMSDIQLVGPNAVGLNEDGILLESTAAGDHTFNSHHDAASLVSSVYTGIKTPQQRSVGIKCSLVNNYSHVYYHWLVDILPKVQGVELYESVTRDEVKLIIPPEPSTWMIESLKLLGYDLGDWEIWSGGREHIESVLIVSRRKDRHVPRRSSISWLRDRLCQGIVTNRTSKQPHDRIFVSRRDANWRNIINLCEVLEIVKSRGFKEFIPTDHSVAEQIYAFSKANFIIGPHGSNLANIVFSSDCIIYEIFGESVRSPDYRVLSNMLDLTYFYSKAETRNQGIHVNPEMIAENIDRLLENNGSFD